MYLQQRTLAIKITQFKNVRLYSYLLIHNSNVGLHEQLLNI